MCLHGTGRCSLSPTTYVSGGISGVGYHPVWLGPHWHLSALVPAEADDPPLALGLYTPQAAAKSQDLRKPKALLCACAPCGLSLKGGAEASALSAIGSPCLTCSLCRGPCPWLRERLEAGAYWLNILWNGWSVGPWTREFSKFRTEY